MVRRIAWVLQEMFGVLLVVLNCAGCVLTTTHYDDGKTETRLMGFVHLDTYKSSGRNANLVATRLRSVGVRIGGKSGLGYFDESEIIVPLDCRIVFLVQNDAQLLATKRIIDDDPIGRNLCMTRY